MAWSIKDADEACRISFEAFASEAFRIVEPGVAYEYNWHIGCISEHLHALHDGEITKLIINIAPRLLKSFLLTRAYPAWALGKRPTEKFISTSYGHQVAEQNSQACRRIMRSDWYQRVFPKTQIDSSMDRGMHFETTMRGQYYAAAIGAPLTGLGGDTILIDDPLKPIEAMSDAIRNSTNTAIRGTLFSRLNDKRTGKIALIMQRLHENDPTGHLLADGGWTHLKLPVEAKEPIIVRLGDKKWEMAEGELLFPGRLSREILDQTRQDMSEYHFCTPAESPVLMADLSTKNINEIKPGDSVMGFTIGTLNKRKELKPSIVQKVSCRKSDVVKITLDSGKVIRCTAEHRWYNGRSHHREKYRKIYYPAKVGSKLSRICEPLLPTLKSEKDFRMAGWLAGFFDADGTAVKQMNTRSCLVSFSQGTGRNLPLCKKLEECLNYFGITYKYDDRLRSDNKSTGHLIRTYRLTGNAIENNRKLLHLIQVNKWRNRINEGSFCSRFVRGEERVLSIEPDGNEDVYSMTTETGNYVVWGLASSNCGQYMQSPVPTGGGEFKPDKIQRYQKMPNLKEMNVYILCDPAGGDEIARKKNKLSDRTAMIVIGLAPDNNYYWLDAIIDRLNPTERVDALFKIHREWNKRCGKAPKVGYEKYALMTDTHYIKKKQEDDSYRFPLIELGGRMAKNERIRRMIPDMEHGRWWFPDTMLRKDYMGREIDLVQELLASEMPMFPKARYDDGLDAMSRIYDDDLEALWPRLRPTWKEAIIFDMYEPKQESWVDF